MEGSITIKGDKDGKVIHYVHNMRMKYVVNKSIRTYVFPILDVHARIRSIAC